MEPFYFTQLTWLNAGQVSLPDNSFEFGWREAQALAAQLDWLQSKLGRH
jgi:hypothetical protein